MIFLHVENLEVSNRILLFLAPYVSGTSLAVAPAVIKETPAVSSYQLNTGRIDTVSQAHYGTVHTPIVSAKLDPDRISRIQTNFVLSHRSKKLATKPMQFQSL